MDAAPTLVRVEGLTMAYGDKLIQRDLTFDVRRGEVLAIIGGSGCGKSTLLRHLIGLLAPAAGTVRYIDADGEQDLLGAPPEREALLRRRFGVMFQAGALWSSMTVGENVMLPLELFADDAQKTQDRAARARECLALVGLAEQFDAEPSALSGGQKKRAAIARALALDPPLLYLDEPSAGLDPLTSALLDELIVNLRDEHQRSVVLVSHELESIFAVADRALFLDAERKTMTALDAPQTLLESGPEEVKRFLRRTHPAEKREEVAA
ncbi:ATP-binding cassette domain-containing protein [Aquincola sp. S2]|uniref:ATP-binding cassette domain-containing protein n=1 Tax=Pseudaquabacterium terrae TaxID=2732868 RepID=A0ABX2EHT4_9BURK|nr:ATP-binding cassette domain-containing protein [Aquabacterium terrae]NRF68141.1 ATP-binding cassette domain-containing protein [Aquabacterium terrae]